jgi:hypothetical protein
MSPAVSNKLDGLLSCLLARSWSDSPQNLGAV